ncbi:MAG: hypothetical protein F4Y53_06620 [Proteobacteria bacterium]|nr:hypothetical protein [Pseudomonadota bacterium]
MSLLIALFGGFTLYMVEYYIAEWRLGYHSRQVNNAVSDTWGVIDAAYAWANDHDGTWPHDDRQSNPTINIEQLVDDGYLRTVPVSRYSECGQCRKDPVTQRFPACCHSLASRDLFNNSITTDPTGANDLIVRFSVWGKRIAKLVASQVPLGEFVHIRQDEYQITAQVPLDRSKSCIGAQAGIFVRLCNEDRTVVFDDGHLQGVSRITRQEQSTTSTRIDGAGIHLDTDELYVGVFNAGAQEPVNTAAYLSLQKSATETNTWASLLLWDANRSTHAMRFGLSADGDNKPDPYLSLLASNGSSLRMEFNKAASGSGVFHPAYWDIYLANKGSHPNHQSVQTRLCALEADSDDVDQDCTCERTASFSCTPASL